MKKIVLLGIILLNVLVLSAQHLKIQKEKSLLYITHKVMSKQTLYSLGRLYNISPKEIAAANKLNTNAGIQVGQQIKIPLKKENFSQTNTKTKGSEPVYHSIKKGENLFKVSRSYNVKEASLKKWNKLSKNVVKPGQEIIVGYLKMDVQAEITDKTEVAATPKQVKDTVKDVAKNSNQVTSVVKPVIVISENSTPLETNAVSTASNEGFFAANYSINAANAQEKKITGTAATFKSTSGWSDKKYYVLTNGISPETIVKVTVNGKSVYAKVLESLPELKDNNGLVCRLSNSTASALGITDPKFDVEISFYE